MNLKKTFQLFVKELKSARGWLIFVPLGIVLFNLYINLKLRNLPPEARDLPIFLSAIVYFPLLIVIFIKGITILRSERNNGTLEYLKALPINGLEIAISKSALLSLESLAYAIVYLAAFQVTADITSKNYTLSIKPGMVILLWFIMWLISTLALTAQTVGMCVRRFGRILGFTVLLALSWVFNKLYGLVYPLLAEMPRISLFVIKGMGLSSTRPVTLGTLVFVLACTAFNIAVAGYLIENKMEV